MQSLAEGNRDLPTALPDVEGLEHLSLSANGGRAALGTGDVRIGIDISDAVAVVQLNRPAKRNALTQAMIERLVAVLEHLDKEDSVRAMVVMGTRKGAFCGQSPLFHGHWILHSCHGLPAFLGLRYTES